MENSCFYRSRVPVGSFSLCQPSAPTQECMADDVGDNQTESRIITAAQTQLSKGRSSIQTLSFFAHLQYTMKKGYSFLDFSMLASLSRTNKNLNVACRELWTAFENPKIFRHVGIENFLPIYGIFNFKFDNPQIFRHVRIENFLPIHGIFNAKCVALRALEMSSITGIKVAQAGLSAIGYKCDLEECLIIAVEHAKIRQLNTLMNFGIDITTIDAYGDTILTLAASVGHPKAIKNIINHLNKQIAKSGPDFIATKRRVKYFIESRNFSGKTALTIAKEKFHNATNDADWYMRLDSVKILVQESSRLERIKWATYMRALNCFACCCLSTGCCFRSFGNR